MIWLAVFVGLELSVCFVYGFKTYRKRLHNIWIAVDQLGNAWSGGDPGETISSRAAKQSHKKGWHALGFFLEKIDPGHMARSIVDDRGDDAAWK